MAVLAEIYQRDVETEGCVETVFGNQYYTPNWCLSETPHTSHTYIPK